MKQALGREHYLKTIGDLRVSNPTILKTKVSRSNHQNKRMKFNNTVPVPMCDTLVQSFVQ